MIKVEFDPVTGMVLAQGSVVDPTGEGVYIEEIIRAPAYVVNGEVALVPESPGPWHRWDWGVKQWLPQLPEAILDALDRVDTAAGRARLSYITDVPGQQATYARKEQQARDWLAAGFAGPAPSFIAAEASALGVQPQLLAQQVLELAEFWAEVKGPEIEAARIKWKAAVRSATTLEAVQAAIDAALAELEAL